MSLALVDRCYLQGIRFWWCILQSTNYSITPTSNTFSETGEASIDFVMFAILADLLPIIQKLYSIAFDDAHKPY